MYVIDNREYTKRELLHLAAEQRTSCSEEWKRRVYAFIYDWLSDAPGITIRSSGTTGRPRKFTVPKTKMRASARATIDYFHLQEGMNCVLCLSPEYIAGKMMIVRALEARMNLLMLEPKANPLDVLKVTIDFTALVPYQVLSILESNATKLQAIRTLLVGGSRMSPVLEKSLESFPGQVYETFGMTETLTHFAVRAIPGKQDRVFKTLPRVQISQTEDHCLIVDAPWFPERPVVTRDLVEICSKDTFLWIGRRDHVINSGGVKIIPEEIERIVAPRLPDHSIFIAGLPDEKLGQRAVLFMEDSLQSDPRNLPLSSDMKNNLFQGLSVYEIPKEIIIVPHFFRTPSGKIRRDRTVKHYS